MRLIFLGSGEFGLPTLQSLREGHEVVAVVSQPDRPAGRQRKLTPTPIAAWAEHAGLAVLKPEDANAADFVGQIKALGAEASVVIAFGQKLGPALLAALGGLSVNLHASLLPALRGAAPINWAILNGDKQAGVSVISLAERMDAGLIYAQVATPIGPSETAGELHDRLALLGPEVVQRVLEQWQAGTLVGQAQDESRATRAPKLSKADGQVSFDMTAEQVCRHVHGLTPWPGVQVLWRRGDAAAGTGHKDSTLIIRRVEAEPDMMVGVAAGSVIDGDRVAVRDGVVHLLELQVPGGRPMRIEEFRNGHPLAEGDLLVGIEPT